MKKTYKLLAYALLISFVLLFSACQSTEIEITTTNRTTLAVGGSISAISKAAEEITPKSEYEIGRSVASNILNSYRIYKDAPETTAYLNKICKAITINSPMPYLYNDYCVSILDTEEINAMATPGGHILISRGILNCTDSEDAIAAIIAHEIAHIQLGHSIAVIRSSRISSAAVKTAKAGLFISAEATMNSLDIHKDELRYELLYHGIDVNNVMDKVDQVFDTTEKVAQKLVVSGFSQEQEFDADTEALFLMESAGYNADAMLSMLTLIENYNYDNYIEYYDYSHSGWNKTHPSPKSRIKRAKKIIKKNHFYVGDSNVRQQRFEENIQYIKY